MIKKLLGWLRGLWKTSKTKKAIAIIPLREGFLDTVWLDGVCKKYGLKISPDFPPNNLHAKEAYIRDMIFSLQTRKNVAVTNVNKVGGVRDYISVRNIDTIRADIWVRPTNLGEM